MPQGYRVLHVDDDDGVLLLAGHHLSAHGIEVISRQLESAEDAEYLYKWIRERPEVFDQYSALVLDQRCAGTARFAEEFAAALRAANIDVPVIAYSGELYADKLVYYESGNIQAAVDKTNYGGLYEAIEHEGRRVEVKGHDIWN